METMPQNNDVHSVHSAFAGEWEVVPVHFSQLLTKLNAPWWTENPACIAGDSEGIDN